MIKSVKKKKSLEKKLVSVIESNNIEALKKIISQSEEVVYTRIGGCKSLLHLSCSKEKDEISAYLIKIGADPYMQDSDGVTPFHLSVTSLPIFESILKKKNIGGITKTCNAGNNILHYIAIRFCRVDWDLINTMVKV